MKKKIKVVAIYVRVSTLEQAKEGYSVSEQIKRLTKFSEAHDWIIFKVYVDAGKSGADMDREALQEMLAAINEGRIDAVLVFKLDRLSRTQRDILELIDGFMDNDVEFVSMSESLDTSTPYGRAMIGILAAFAQLERDTIKERMAIGKEGRAAEGKWHGGPFIPFGYTYDTEKEYLEIEEYGAMIVKEIFRMFNERISVNAIVNRLNKVGLKRGSDWEPRTIKYVLKNKTYIGLLKHGEKYHKGLHEAIIDNETFDTAQEIFKEREAEEYEHTPYAHSSYLGGLIWCGNCGGRYHKKIRSRLLDGSKKYNYSCYSRVKSVKHMIKDPECKHPHVKMEELDEFIFSQIRMLKADPEFAKSLQSKPIDDEAGKRIEIIERHIKDLENQSSKLMDLYSLNGIDLEELRSKIENIATDKKRLQLQIVELVNEPSMDLEDAMEIIDNFDTVLDNGDFDEIRGAITALIERIVVIDKDNVEIYWTFA